MIERVLNYFGYYKKPEPEGVVEEWAMPDTFKGAYNLLELHYAVFAIIHFEMPEGSNIKFDSLRRFGLEQKLSDDLCRLPHGLEDEFRNMIYDYDIKTWEGEFHSDRPYKRTLIEDIPVFEKDIN